jgi:hypothetical protein
MLQVPPDYSRQLEDIAKALNRPASPSLGFSLLLLVLGAALTLTGQLVARWSDNWWKIRKIRRKLYLDIVRLFYAVDDITNLPDIPEVDRYDWQKDQLRRHITFDVEKHLKANGDMYLELPERPAADLTDSYSHQIVEEEKWMPVSAGRAIRTLAGCVVSRAFQEKYFRAFMAHDDAEKFFARVRGIAADSEIRFRAAERTPGGGEPGS